MLSKEMTLLGRRLCRAGCQIRRCSGIVIPEKTIAVKDNEHKFIDNYRHIMATVPQPVVVVTTALNTDSGFFKRGMTCSSFTSVSLFPPIVSFAMNRPSRMHDLLLKTGHFAVHVLGQNQADLGIHFSQPAGDKDQFEAIPHVINERENPVLDSTVALLECSGHSVHLVGDHYVWYGTVEDCVPCTQGEPLIYFARSYRSVSDELLMRAFESTDLPFEEWTHNAHLRMCWNYIKEYGFEKAKPMIRDGIRKYNEKYRDKFVRGYHETVTNFFIHMVNHAVSAADDDENFEDFIAKNNHLMDSRILFEYYSAEILNSPKAKHSFVLPDKKSLP